MCMHTGFARAALPERIPFDSDLGYPDEHVSLTLRGYSLGKWEEPPYARILELLLDCPTEAHGRVALRQCRGASFKQLALIAHLAGLSKEQRGVWYGIARNVPLSEQHAAHLINRLKERSGSTVA